MYERLKMIREYFKMSQSQFAKSLGMGQSTLGMLEVNKREILDRHIKTVCSIYNINENWFRTGEGEMINPYEEDDELEYLIGAIGDSKFKRSFITFMLKQPENNWDMIEKMIEDFNEYLNKK